MKPALRQWRRRRVPRSGSDPNLTSLFDLFAVTFREPWVMVSVSFPRYRRRQAHHPGRWRIGRRHQSRSRAGRHPVKSCVRRRGRRADRPHAARERDLRDARSELKETGQIFVGIDVIDGNLTEINVTSPTGLRQIAQFGGPDVAAMIWDVIEAKVTREKKR